MPFNPFNSDGTSLENDNPVIGATKKVTTVASDQTVQQTKAVKQSFTDQLYGNNVLPNDESDPQNSSSNLQSNPSPSAHTNTAGQHQAAKTPGEQLQLDETRRKLQELQSLHKKSYFEITFGEEAQAKRRQQEEQEQQAKLSEEEELKQRENESKVQKEEEMAALMPKGRNRMRPPLAVTKAKTITEINRGTSG